MCGKSLYTCNPVSQKGETKTDQNQKEIKNDKAEKKQRELKISKFKRESTKKFNILGATLDVNYPIRRTLKVVKTPTKTALIFT